MGGSSYFFRLCAVLALAAAATGLSGAADLSVPGQVAQAQTFEEELWERVRDSGDAVLLETYIRTFPTGAHVPEAYQKIQQLRAEGGATREGGKTGAAGSESASRPSGEKESAAAEPAPQYRPGEGGWIGIELQEYLLTDGQKLVSGRERGIRIVSVLPFGQGVKAGLRAEDIILAHEGAPVGPMPDLIKTIGATSPGTTVTLTVLRGLESMEVDVVLGGRVTDTLRGAEAGHAVAQLEAGHMYATGQGVERDEGQARRWLLAAAGQGNPIAQYYLGNIHNEGRGVAKDPAVASDWYRRSAEGGYALAQTQIGYNYVHGLGVPKNPALGVEWYLKAAAQKEPYALNNLGMMYADGQGGLRKDRDRAIELLREAAARGNELAVKNLNDMKVAAVDPAKIQRALADLGFDPGPADGKIGPQTRRAIRAFQEQAGLAADTNASPQLLRQLEAALQGRAPGNGERGAAVARPAPASAARTNQADFGDLGDLDTLD